MIEYREFNCEEDFIQCVDLQKRIFNLSDIDVISPSILKLIARNDPPIGISLGLFTSTPEKNELIGFVIGFATFLTKSLYVVLMGTKPEYQNKIYTYRLMIKLREIALSRNIESLYGIFDPLDVRIARFDVGRLGSIPFKYEIDKYLSPDVACPKQIPNDKLISLWELNSKKSIDKMNGSINLKTENIIKNYPIVTNKHMPDSLKVLMEIPENFIQLKKDSSKSALQWRISTREILAEYINNRNYIISNCHSLKINKERKTYYLLEKQKC
jgi:predicted GNAT superfamily acetyltransferase